MQVKETKDTIYISPILEVIEFSIEDSIATSGVGASLFEQVWSGGDSA